MFLSGIGSKFFEKLSDGSSNQKVMNLVTKERSWIGGILNAIRLFGTGVALIALVIMAITYFQANGRGGPFAAEQTAKIKTDQLKNFAIGAIIFIGASNILYYLSDFAIQLLGDIF
jgi:hypothetical protein